MRIALLGTTGYIGRSILAEARERGMDVVPFSRDPKRAKEVLESYGIAVPESCKTYTELCDTSYDVIINATGIGSARAFAANPEYVFEVTESVDTLLHEYFKKFAQTHIYTMSSGAVYGDSCRSAITDDTTASFTFGALRDSDRYAIAKLYSEIKHRAWSEAVVVDMRVFAFFSRYADVSDTFFLSEVAKCLREKVAFTTNASDMVRDVVTAADILDLIVFLEEKGPTNSAYNMQTKAPVAKFELLDHLAKEFGLQYEIDGEVRESATGQKNEYYAQTSDLKKLGYAPKRTSLENVTTELRAFLLH